MDPEFDFFDPDQEILHCSRKYSCFTELFDRMPSCLKIVFIVANQSQTTLI